LSDNGRLTAGGGVFFDARPTTVASGVQGSITVQTDGERPTPLYGAP
jgi:hypothetical protein